MASLNLLTDRIILADLLVGGTTLATADTILYATGQATFNEQGSDVDFRIEGDTDTEVFFVDASTNRVGISTTTPGSTLDVQGTLNVTGDETHVGVVDLTGTFKVLDGDIFVGTTAPVVESSADIVLREDGRAIFNEQGRDADFRIEGDTKANLFFIDASADMIGVNQATPASLLHLTPHTAAAFQIDPFGASAGNTGEARFLELAANGTNYVGFKAPDSIAANKVWVLPNADGSSGQFLKTDGSLALSWATAAAGSGLVYTAVKTSAHSAANGELVRCDINTTGSFTVTFPASPTTDDKIGVVLTVGTATAGRAVTVDGNGKTLNGNHDNKLYAQNDLIVYQYDGTAWWTIENGLIPHSCSLARNTAQAGFTSGASTQVQLNSTEHDTGLLADLASYRAVIRRTGDYTVVGSGSVAAVMDDNEYIAPQVYVNGTRVRQSTDFSTGTNNRLLTGMASTIRLTAGDLVTLYIEHIEGGSQSSDTATVAHYPRLTIQEVSL